MGSAGCVRVEVESEPEPRLGSLGLSLLAERLSNAGDSLGLHPREGSSRMQGPGARGSERRRPLEELAYREPCPPAPLSATRAPPSTVAPFSESHLTSAPLKGRASEGPARAPQVQSEAPP